MIPEDGFPVIAETTRRHVLSLEICQPILAAMVWNLPTDTRSHGFGALLKMSASSFSHERKSALIFENQPKIDRVMRARRQKSAQPWNQRILSTLATALAYSCTHSARERFHLHVKLKSDFFLMSLPSILMKVKKCVMADLRNWTKVWQNLLWKIYPRSS